MASPPFMKAALLSLSSDPSSGLFYFARYAAAAALLMAGFNAVA